MRKRLYTLSFTLLFLSNCWAQDVTFTFSNSQNTNDGTDDFYEVDILAESTAGFKLGQGLLYINYDTMAFGSKIFTNGNIEITYPSAATPPYVLGSEYLPGFGFYNNFVTNDNSASKVAFSWQQALSAGSMASNNISSSAAPLFHLRIKYVDVNQDPGICFDSTALFTDQTFTACGPSSGFGFADCGGNPGIQITNDSYDCTGYSLVLPVELLEFTAQAEGKTSQLKWSTASEMDNLGFNVERKTSEGTWETLTFIKGQGTSLQTNHYQFIDKSTLEGTNYYRLKQLDIDGVYEYSDTRAVTFKSNNLVVEDIYPNPSISGNAMLEIRSPKKTSMALKVYNLTGQLQLDQQIELVAGRNAIRIKMDNQQSSTYIIRLQIGNEVFTQRMLIASE